MVYRVSYTDSINKGEIIVDDGTINQDTSLSLPGRAYTGYGKAVAENFLHLLENFANTTPPERPVEGQLWYDNTQGVDQLKIYDGTTWASAGGLKKSESEPAVANSIVGDLWVNTENQQLYLFTGSTWILVGPDFSDGLLTGGQAQSIVGSDDLTYNVFVIKIEDKPAVIFSSQSFIPKSAIPGFRSGINAGINLAQTPIVGTEVLKYFGTAEKAESLIVGGEAIPASNFLRGNAESTTDFKLRIKSNEGVQIGSGGQFSIGLNGETGIIQNNTNGASIAIRLNDGTSLNSILTIDSTQKVGINNIAPDEELDLVGNLQVSSLPGNPLSGVIKVESTLNSTDINDGSIVTKGGVGIAQNLNVGGATSITGILTTNNIAPDQTGIRNIGTVNNKYDQVYATTFFGNLSGNVSGTVTGRAGSANRLTSATTFSIEGDVEPNSFDFDGAGGPKTFDVRIANSFISNKERISDADNTDEILLNRVIGETGVYKISKRNFLKSIPLVPAGVIVPYAGRTAPEGWLLCDGSEVRKSDYSELFAAIEFNFRDPALISDNGVNFFALPDLRGRMPLGADNMGGNAAGVVTNSAAENIGNIEGSEFKNIGVDNLPEHEHDMEGESGTQYYGLRAASGALLDETAINLPLEPGLGGTQGFPSSGGILTEGSTGQPFDVMNPYLTVNYIIYTGN